jgi:1,4-dihydroxy-2-naphthoate octaprenyltransferase
MRLAQHRIPPVDRTSTSAWRLAARPQTLPAAVAPVLVGLGAGIASGTPIRADTAVGCLAVALLLQIAANLANDLSDFRRGADAPDRAGPTRAAAAGLLTPRQLEAGVASVLALAGMVGLYLAWVGGPILLALGALAMLAAVAYTGGPLPYGYRGLGEVFVFLFFGLVAVTGTAYLQTLRVDALAVAAAVPVGALITAILVVNNLRDRPTDARAGKRTLAVRFGDRFAMGEYLAALLVAAAVPVVLVAGGSGVTVLAPLVSLPLAVPSIRTLLAVRADSDRRRLNAVLRDTARVTLLYGAAFAVGLALSGPR